MLVVTDVSSHDFSSIRLDAPRVRDIDSAVERFNGEPFVLTTGLAQRAALIHPGLYANLRQSSGAGVNEHVSEIGFLDALALNQLTVSHNAPAVTVAAVARVVDASVVIALTDSGEAAGVFVPSSVVEELAATSIVVSANLSQRVQELLELDANLPAALALVEERLGTFHSERVNSAKPRPLACSWQGGHFVARCPCRVHSGSACGRLPR